MKKSTLIVSLVAGLATHVHAEGCPWICKGYLGTGSLARYDNRFIGEARGLIFVFPSEGWSTNVAHANAYAACATQYPDPINFRSGGGGISETNNFGAVAAISCGEQYDEFLSACWARRGSNSSGVSTAAYAPFPSGEEDWPEVVVCGHSGASSFTYEETDFLPGAAVGTGNALLDIEYLGSASPSFEAQVLFLPSINSSRLVRDGISLRIGGSLTSFGVTASMSGTSATGNLDEVGGVYSKTVQGSLPTGQSVQIGMSRFSFSDGALDVNGDGRFNQLDSAALFDLICASGCDPNLIERFDFDGSLSINQADVDFLESLIAAGMSSGIFGDANQDGIVDCNDRGGLSLSGYAIGDPEFIIEMDYNLDGLIDASDIAEADAWIPTADIDRDGGVTAGDLDAFFVLYGAGDLAVDFNHNGGVEAGDLDVFFEMFQVGC